jgi:hypothetical protein
MWGDSLYYLSYFDFSSMTKRMKDYKGVKHSSAHVTPDCESVSLKEKQLDFSKFNDYFTDVISPHEAVCRLEELRTEYLRLSLHVLMKETFLDYRYSAYPSKDVEGFIGTLSGLIDLIKTLYS